MSEIAGVVAFLDASALYPALLRNFRMHLASHDLLQARWSDREPTIININGSAHAAASAYRRACPKANAARGRIARDLAFDGNVLSLAPARIASACRFCESPCLPRH